MSRKVARDYAYKLVFEYIFNKDAFDENETKNVFFQDPSLTEKDKEYISDVYNGIVSKYDELIDYISGFSNKFSIDRVFKPDLAILLLAVYEMRYADDIPLSVSINEAVEIVKLYSTEKSKIFVNGILASVYKDLSKCEEGENGADNQR